MAREMSYAGGLGEEGYDTMASEHIRRSSLHCA